MNIPNENQDMSEQRKSKLLIHHANMFEPEPLGITGIAWGVNGELLAITKERLTREEKQPPWTIIEIYRIGKNRATKLFQTIVEHEQLTGIVWISSKHLLTTSKEQTINIYNVDAGGSKVFTTMTDYGPIVCIKFSQENRLLITGTEYGYVATYRVHPKGKSVEPLTKMVKVNDRIQSLDFTIKPREIASVKAAPVEQVKSGKRKRSNQDSDDESEDEGGATDEEYLASLDITVYGASQGQVIAWDFHKKTIIETMHVGDGPCKVLCLLSLKNGDIVVGDSTGTLSVFDNVSFTCKQNCNILPGGISCIAKNSKETNLLVSGRDPAIIVMSKRDNNDYILFEKIEFHTREVTSLLYVGRHEFYSGSSDGLLVKYELRRNRSETEKTTSLDKNAIMPCYSNHIKFSKDEMMIQYDRRLVIWRLPGKMSDGSEDDSESKPRKVLLLKAGALIQSSTFNTKWIAYSTKRRVHLFSRLGDRLESYRTDERLPGCNLLELAYESRFLVASTGNHLYIIDLENEVNQESGESITAPLSRPVVAEHKLKSKALQAYQKDGRLVVASSYPKSYIYIYDLNPESESYLKRLDKINLKNHGISYIAYNSLDEGLIYAYTHSDQLINFDPCVESEKEILSKFNTQKRVDGLPEDANILGLIFLSKWLCVLYDSCRIFKVDLVSNKVVNHNNNYKHIMRLDNSVFDKPHRLVMIN